MSTIIFQAQSICIVGLIFLGLYHRKNRYQHVKTMKTAIVWDLLLVAQIELTRGAIAKVSNPFSNPLILNIHVILAVSTIVLYFLVFLSGRKLQNGEEGIRKVHKLLGLLTVTTRCATLVTSFLVI